MQTWWFDFKPNACFIVREHSATDARGDNLIPENLETGEYVPVYDANMNNLNEGENNLAVVIAAPWKAQYDQVEGKWHFIDFLENSGSVSSGTYSALHYTVIYDNDRAAMANMVNKLLKDGTGVIDHNDAESGGHTVPGDDIDQDLFRISPLSGIRKVYYGDPTTEEYTSSEQTREFVNPVQSIVSIYMCDVNFTPSQSHPERGRSARFSYSTNSIIRPFKNRNGTGSYSPRNKKLYTAPFYFAAVSNRQGTEVNYPLEYFNIDDGITFEAVSDGTPNPSIMYYPLNYKGVDKNKEECITMTGFPVCAWLTDTYKEWLAMNENMMALNKASAITSAITGVASSAVSAVGSGGDPLALAGAGLGAVGSIAQGAFGVAKIMETKRQHSITPLQAKGSIGNTLLAANQICHALFRVYGITAEFASNIDSYFDLYGYATQRVKKPNEKVRRYWTYTKTMNATLDGSLPADDEKKICSIYDNGIRFWNSKVNGKTINGGDYISKYDEYKAANTPI